MEAAMSDSKTSNLSVDWLPIDRLHADPKNPREHSDRQIKLLAASIESLGFNSPILIDRDGKILAGHGRWLAAQKLGLRRVPTIKLEHLTDAQAKAFMLADNRLAEISAFDVQLLAEALRDLSELQLDFSIEATGFTMGEIDLRIEGLSSDTNDPDDKADALPPPLAQYPVSRIGDLWLAGDHRVHCGNALDAHAYKILMRGEHATITFSDPPYNLKIDGNVSGLGRFRHREFAMASGEMNEAEFTAFLTLAGTLLAHNSVDGSIHYICTDWRHLGELSVAGSSAFSELLNVCVWCKHNAGMGSFYRSAHELVFVFKSGHGRHRNNIQLGQYGRHRSNVWSYPGANSFGRATDEGYLPAHHPTVKPVRLVADAILDCSARGDIVVDAFLGSRTTLIAAERVGRRCYGIEIDPLYVDTIIRRWQAFTGDKATHADTGKRFDDLAGEAEARHD
jgi:DNA modification methylase